MLRSSKLHQDNMMIYDDPFKARDNIMSILDYMFNKIYYESNHNVQVPDGKNGGHDDFFFEAQYFIVESEGWVNVDYSYL